jgi:uncharacterized membrane protein YbjE (DUF340 family)
LRTRTIRELGPALAFAAGALGGYLGGPPAGHYAETLLGPLILALAAAVGAYIGSSPTESLGALAAPGAVAGLVAATVAGGLAAGLLGAAAWGGGLGGHLAIALGSGWYSFTGSYLALRDPLLGAVAFASNLLREAVVLVAYPVLARLVGPLPAVSAGGATTMDTTLPVIARTAGAAVAAVALAHGIIVTLLVPILVPAVYP